MTDQDTKKTGDQEKPEDAKEKTLDEGWEETSVPGVFVLAELEQKKHGWKVTGDLIKELEAVLGKEAVRKLKWLKVKDG